MAFLTIVFFAFSVIGFIFLVVLFNDYMTLWENTVKQSRSWGWSTFDTFLEEYDRLAPWLRPDEVGSETHHLPGSNISPGAIVIEERGMVLSFFDYLKFLRWLMVHRVTRQDVNLWRKPVNEWVPPLNPFPQEKQEIADKGLDYLLQQRVPGVLSTSPPPSEPEVWEPLRKEPEHLLHELFLRLGYRHRPHEAPETQMPYWAPEGGWYPLPDLDEAEELFRLIAQMGQQCWLVKFETLNHSFRFLVLTPLEAKLYKGLDFRKRWAEDATLKLAFLKALHRTLAHQKTTEPSSLKV